MDRKRDAVPVRGGEPQIPILPLRDSSLCQKSAVFEHARRDRAAADRGTLGICARLRVAGHPYHPGGRSGEVVGPRQLGRWSAPQNSDFLLADHLKAFVIITALYEDHFETTPPSCDNFGIL